MREEDCGDPARAEQLALRAAERGHHNAVADLGAVRELTGDLSGAERLYSKAVTAGLAPDLRQVTRLRLSAGTAPDDVAPLYDHACNQGFTGAGLVLARVHLARGSPRDAAAHGLHAANLGDPTAVPELVLLNRELGDTTTASLMDQYGLQDDGSAATGFLW
jgi:hypothetical protein